MADPVSDPDGVGDAVEDIRAALYRIEANIRAIRQYFFWVMVLIVLNIVGFVIVFVGAISGLN